MSFLWNKSPNDWSQSRRRFLSSTLSAAGTLTLLRPTLAHGALAKTSPSERLTMALIGHGAMGRGHLRLLADESRVELLAVCDVDQTRRDDALERVKAAYESSSRPGRKGTCKAYNDYREILARPEIDAVLIATPDHWHTPMSIHAAQAGKDVYCEKPISISIQEGRQLVEAVRRAGRIFQTGTQYRSIPVIRQVCDFVRNGGLGQVKAVFTLWNKLGLWTGAERFKPYAEAVQIEKTGDSNVPLHFAMPAVPVPNGLDWDLWVGPAPWHPYNPAYHINPSPGVVPWSFDEDFGTASVTWHHSHSADVLQYALGFENSGPTEIIHPSSGKFPTLTCKYANGTLLHLVENWGQVISLYKAVPENARLAGNFGALFLGERGWITSMSTGGPIEGGPREILREARLHTREVAIGTNNHHANWFQCVKTRAKPYCDEEIGNRGASLGHLIIIGYRLGRSLKWEPAKEEFVNDDAANRLRGRTLREPWRV